MRDVIAGVVSRNGFPKPDEEASLGNEFLFGSRNPALRRATVEVEFTSAKKVQKIHLAPDINGRNLHQNSTARLESASKTRREEDWKSNKRERNMSPSWIAQQTFHNKWQTDRYWGLTQYMNRLTVTICVSYFTGTLVLWYHLSFNENLFKIWTEWLWLCW